MSWPIWETRKGFLIGLNLAQLKQFSPTIFSIPRPTDDPYFCVALPGSRIRCSLFGRFLFVEQVIAQDGKVVRNENPTPPAVLLETAGRLSSTEKIWVNGRKRTAGPPIASKVTPSWVVPLWTVELVLCTKADYADFELRFQVKVDNGLNSGVQIRSKSLPEKDNGRVHGPQSEIEASPGEAGYVYGEATGRNGFPQLSLRTAISRTTSGTSTTSEPLEPDPNMDQWTIGRGYDGSTIASQRFHRSPSARNRQRPRAVRSRGSRLRSAICRRSKTDARRTLRVAPEPYAISWRYQIDITRMFRISFPN